MGLFDRFAGAHNGRIFKIVPDYVDVKRAPGDSVIPAVTFLDWAKSGPLVLWNTPNTVWAAISLLVYFAFPYDLSATSVAASGPLSWAFFAQRFPLWFAVTYGYTAFWHVTLYHLGWAERPFIRNRVYNLDKVAHNMCVPRAARQTTRR